MWNRLNRTNPRIGGFFFCILISFDSNELMCFQRCSQVIGLDSASEVEEAEQMCEINQIKNASFVTGQPKEVMATIANVLSNVKATAIINTNAIIARGEFHWKIKLD